MSRLLLNLTFVFIVVAASKAVTAEDVAAAQPAGKGERVVYLREQPHISRVPLKVVDPVDVTIAKGGDTYVADRVGEVIFRVDAWGDVSLIGEDLAGLSRVSRSAFGTFALLASRGSGEIVQLSNNGFRSGTHLPFRPAGLAIDGGGVAYVTKAASGELYRLDPDGGLKQVTSVSEPTLDLAINSLGTVYMLLRSGKVVTVFPDGQSKEVKGYLPEATTRIAIEPNSGDIVGLAKDVDEKSALYRATKTHDEVVRFASVVRGTSAFAFDKLGNLTLASPDLRAITQVKTHFRVPSPETGEPFLLILSPNAPVRGEEDSESF